MTLPVRAVLFGLGAAGFGGLLLLKTIACGGDDSKNPQAPGAASSNGGTTSSGQQASGGTTSGQASGGTSSGGPVGPVADDDGVVPANSIWRTTTEWFRPIDTAPVAGNSGEMIGALTQWGQNGVFQIDFSFNVLNGAGAPTTKFPPNEEGDDVPVPIPAKGYIEGDNAYDACPGDEDCHLIVFDYPNNRLYETYQAHKNGATWDGLVTMWKLDKAYPPTNRGAGCTSADAAGIQIAPGLIGYKETKKGTINHALRFIIRNDFIRGVRNDKNVPNNVYPASHGSTLGNAALGIPYGGRLRLKASVLDTDPRFKSPGAKAIAKALHKYGMILADGGNIPLVAESVKVHKDANAAETWDGLLGPTDVGFLKPGDFEVIGIPKENPAGAAGWYVTKAEYEAQLKKPLGCNTIVQP